MTSHGASPVDTKTLLKVTMTISVVTRATPSRSRRLVPQPNAVRRSKPTQHARSS